MAFSELKLPMRANGLSSLGAPYIKIGPQMTDSITQAVELPAEVYRKLAQGAAERGMTIESLLTVVSELVALLEQPTELDRQRCKRIDKLLDLVRDGTLDAKVRTELDQLIESDYHAANARADQLISAKQRRPGDGLPPGRKPNGSTRPAKHSR